MTNRARHIAIVPGSVLSLAVLLLLALFTPGAHAAKSVDSTFGTKSGTPALGGTFLEPGQVAVRQATGQIYVADSENNRIQRFGVDDNGTPANLADDSHVFERAWGWDVVQAGGVGDTPDGSFEICTVASQCKAGVEKEGVEGNTGAGQFFSFTPIPIAVDQSTGDVYIAAGRRVQKFSADGEVLSVWGWDVVASGPGNTGGYEVCVPDEGDVCKSAGSSGDPNAGFGAAGDVLGADDVDVGPDGSVYVLDGSGLRVQKFSSDGTPLRLWGWDVVASGPGNVSAKTEVQEIAVDASGGTFTLSFEGETTAPIREDAKAAEVKDALAALVSLAPNQGHFPAEVSGPDAGPWTVSFHWRLGNMDQPQLVADGSGLIGGLATVSVSTISDGASYEVCVPASGDVCKAGVDGSFGPHESPYLGGSRLGLVSRPAYVAVDSQGRVYISDPPSGRVQRFGSDGQSPEIFAVAPQPVDSTDVSSSFHHITVDRSNDHPFVIKGTGVKGEAQIAEFDPDGNLLASHAVGAGLDMAVQPPTGLALHESSGRLYVSTFQVDHWVLVLDDDGGFQRGEATPQPATAVGEHSATLHGLVDPNGFATTYQFEYSLDGSSWTKVGTRQSAGSGDGNVPVSAAITGLQANREYEFRIAVATTFAGEGVSAIETFTTSQAAPEAESFYPRSRTATTATLTGVVNANNLPTDYYFEWGETTAYGTKAPIGGGVESGGERTVVLEEIEGLQPGTSYHYRLVAENEKGTAVGEDIAFATRVAVAGPGVSACPVGPAATRCFEMVTPPFKVTRGTVANGVLGANRLIGGPSLDGETVRWKLNFFPLLDETRTPFNGDELIMRRTPSGWTIKSLLTQPILPDFVTQLVDATQVGASGDLETGAWSIGKSSKPAALLPNESSAPLHQYTRRDGTGTNGWTGWLSNVEEQQIFGAVVPSDSALFSDDGSWMVRWGDYRKLLGDTAATDPSATQFAGRQGGRAIYRQGDPPSGALDLVNGCTGTAGSGATVIPRRVGGGAANDLLSTQVCESGAVVSRRGAIVGANHVGSGHGGDEYPLLGPSATAMANDGSRIYFTSPDPSAPTTPQASCESSTTLPSNATAVGANTNCPPQLYLRHYDALGKPTVRWISRPAPGMPTQQIGLLGPAVFQGASRDGDTVYFKTSSPLTADDPNGTGSPGPVTTGTASADSWDLYRYEVPADPATETGALTRITGGPTGAADPGTHGLTGGAARFVSDDGKRAYFVTDAPIAGADAEPPKGAAAAPADDSGMVLYLFDDNETGAARWRFIANLPLATDPRFASGYNACASYFSVLGPDSGSKAGSEAAIFDLETIGPGSCVRGTPDGDGIVFVTQGRLTGDDTDDAADVYLYDAVADELVRVTAPRGPDSTYGCSETRVAVGAPLTTIVPCRGQLIGWMKHTGTQQTNEFDRGWGGDRYMNIAEDANGTISVFFESRAQLLPADQNDNSWDVYQWREGELTLISRGRPGHHSYFSGNGLDGRDVFIYTSDRIDPRELDDGDYDIYDARIGGGFEYVPPPEPCDALALACEDEATPPPAVPNGVSGAPTSGNVAKPPRRKPRCGKGKVRRRGRCVARKTSGRKRGAKQRKGGRR